jgi:hypothetical protein
MADEPQTSRVTIKSDGTPAGTEVLIDGKRVQSTWVSFAIGTDGLARVQVEMYADEIEVDGIVDLVLETKVH